MEFVVDIKRNIQFERHGMVRVLNGVVRVSLILNGKVTHVLVVNLDCGQIL